jgi:hypothetical protein
MCGYTAMLSKLDSGGRMPPRSEWDVAGNCYPGSTTPNQTPRSANRRAPDYLTDIVSPRVRLSAVAARRSVGRTFAPHLMPPTTPKRCQARGAAHQH